MSWQEIGALGELIGALASVVLLAYIAYQIRQNSQALKQGARATQAASRQAFGDLDQTYLNSALDPSVVARALAKSEHGEELSPLELSQLGHRQHLNFRVFEAAFYQFHKGVLDASEWDRYARIIRLLLRNDTSAQAMWARAKGGFAPDFVSEAEKLRDDAS